MPARYHHPAIRCLQVIKYIQRLLEKTRAVVMGGVLKPTLQLAVDKALFATLENDLQKQRSSKRTTHF